MQTVTIKVHNGKLTVESNGIKGDACTDIHRKIAEALGAIEDQTETPERYEAEQGNQAGR